MHQYLDGLNHIMNQGFDKPNRTGVVARSVFGMQMRYNMADGFPAVTTKKLAFKLVVAELLWFISGSTDLAKLHAHNVHIWDDDYTRWAAEGRNRYKGDLGRVYGAQWRTWQGPNGLVVDQLAEVIAKIKQDPSDRRLIVNAWNPGELNQMALPPCHAFFQFYVADGKLSLQMYQRSCDMFLGVPFNIASYSLLLHMIAQVTNLAPGEFIHVLGDAHIYQNHFEQVREQVARNPLPLPTLWLNPDISDINDFMADDVKLVGYNHHQPIKAALNVGFPKQKETAQ